MKTQQSQDNFKEDLTLPDYYKITVMKIVCQSDIKTDKTHNWDRIKTLETDPHVIVNWFSTKAAKQFYGKRSLLTNGAGITRYSD